MINIISQVLIRLSSIYRLLTENWESLVTILDNWLERLQPLDDNAAFNFVNALENLLWAFERRATASLLFQLAVKRNIYQDGVFRYNELNYALNICYCLVLKGY